MKPLVLALVVLCGVDADLNAAAEARARARAAARRPRVRRRRDATDSRGGLPTCLGSDARLHPCRASLAKLLITSPGGVGSSDAFARFASTNHRDDADGLKHRRASFWRWDRCRGARDGNVYLYNARAGWCFDEIVVVVGDPLHAIESVTARYGCRHVRKMNAAAERCSPRALLRGGRDASGVTGYLESWLAAFEESRNGSSAWPRMLLASTRDVYATRCVDAFVGPEHRLRRRDPAPYRARAATGNYSSDELRALDRAYDLVHVMERIGGCVS